MHVLRVVWKNTLIFAHNCVIIIIVLLFALPPLDWSLLLVPFGVLALLVNAIWFGILLGLISVRFRDIPQLVTSVLQVGLFLTPILWKVEMLGTHQWLAWINPVFHFIELIRSPLMGTGAAPFSWAAVGLITLIGSLTTLVLFSRFRSRIAYWV